MDLPRTRSTREPSATLDDLIFPPLDDLTVKLNSTSRFYDHRGHLIGQIADLVQAGRIGRRAAEDEPFNASALAEVMREAATLRANSDARERLLGAVDEVIRPAIAEATAAGVGVLIAYGPDEAVARPSNAVRRGEALLLRTDRLSTLLSRDPIAFDGANA